MPISFAGKPKEDDVVSLIAAKKYARAIEVLKAQIRQRGANTSQRMQLADVLVLADKKSEAIGLLLPLADQYANEGFAAKAVSVLKKVQKIDPRRREVEARLAQLIEEKQREAATGPLSRTAGANAAGAPFDDGPALEIGFEMGPISTPAAAPTPARMPGPVPAWSNPNETLPFEPTPVPLVEAEPLPSLDAEPVAARPAEALPALEVDPVAPAGSASAALPVETLQEIEVEPEAPARASKESEEIEDYDLLYLPQDGSGEEDVLPIEVEAVDEGSGAAEPMSAGQFADELMSLVDSAFQERASGGGGAPPAAGSTASRPGTQIVVSPLFRDFSVDEMVAVIEGLKLLAVERGGVILREGQPGASLYMLTSGRVRAFKKDPATGRQSTIGDLQEGAFFGEVSILTGRPRMASVVALTRCELLELDRPTLDEITKTHPRVWDVLREFAARRASAKPSRG